MTRSPDEGKESCLEPLLVPKSEDEDSVAVAMLFRLRGGRPSEIIEESEIKEEKEDISELFERHVALTVESAENPTELCTVSPEFVKVLDICLSRPFLGALFSLWLLVCIGPNALGPPLSAPGLIAFIAFPIILWIEWLRHAWPAAYGACLREASLMRKNKRQMNEYDQDEKKDNEEELTDSMHSDDEIISCANSQQQQQRQRVEMMALTVDNDVDHTMNSSPLERSPRTDDNDMNETTSVNKSRSPPGGIVLKVIARIFPIVALCSLVLAIYNYYHDAIRLDCRIQYNDYYDDYTDITNSTHKNFKYETAKYPWSCSWASGVWLSMRFLISMFTMILLLFFAIAIAHYQALRAALINSQSDSSSEKDHQDDEIPRLIDDANLLFRRAYLLILAVFLFTEMYIFIFILLRGQPLEHISYLLFLCGSGFLCTALYTLAAGLNSIAKDAYRRLSYTSINESNLLQHEEEETKSSPLPVFLHPIFQKQKKHPSLYYFLLLLPLLPLVIVLIFACFASSS